MSHRVLAEARFCIFMALCLLAVTGCTSGNKQMDMNKMNAFAMSYTRAWSSGDPASVASHFSKDGSLRINQNPPSIGRDALTATARSFMTELPDMVLHMDGLDRKGDRFIYR